MRTPSARARRSSRGARLALPLAGLLLASPVPLPSAAQAGVAGRNLTLLAQRDDFPLGPGTISYGSLWCYVHADGREYAALATGSGTAIYNVTVPAAAYLVAHVGGPVSVEREMKSYRDWLYVVCDERGPGEGLQVIRMTDPEHPVLATTYTTGFVRAHTVSVDTARALLYCNGTHDVSGASSGMRILSLANPEAPVLVARWPPGSGPVPVPQYVHDSTPAGDRLHVSSLFGGQRVLDVSDPALPVEIASWTYEGCFAHSAWPDSSGRYLYVADEMTGEPLKVWDLADLGAPVLVNQFTTNTAAIVHNPRVRGHELYLSNYTEGVRVLDASDPVHPAEFGWADSYLAPGGGYNGVWEVCPQLPSGTVIASDMQTGLYVYGVERDYGLLQVRVVESGSGAPLAGAKVVVEGLGDSLVTPADGVVRFAPGPGPWAVNASRFGWTGAGAAMSATLGGLDSATLVLAARSAADFAGTVRDAATALPLAGAEVALAWTPLLAACDSLGGYLLPSVPEDLYRVEVRAPGHVPLAFERRLGPPWSGQDFALQPAALWDDLESASGWTVGAPGDFGGGAWTRVEPLGTGEPPPARLGPGEVQPEHDRSPAPGESCFVTGQGTNPVFIREQDVDGRTTLTSPPFDLTAMSEPVIGYWRWFYSDVDDGDWLAAFVSGDGGASWVPVDTTRGQRNRWEQRTIRVRDFVGSANPVRVRFVAAELPAESLVEAAIDDVAAWDEADATVSAPGAPPGAAPRALRLTAPRPNPSRAGARFTLEMPRAGEALVEVLDLAGRRVRTLHRGPAPEGPLALAWDGADALGRAPGAGLYFVRASACGERAEAKLVRIE